MKKQYRKIIFAFLSLIIMALNLNAQEKNSFKHQIVVGYNFGATTPVPLPREVRGVDAYWPQFTPHFGYNISYKFQGKWALESGILLDLKGMGVRDRVKYMYTDVVMEGDNVKGYFSGKNETEVKITYVTIPIRVSYSINNDWDIRGGAYFSYRSSSEFSGTVWDGVLRETQESGNIIDGTIIEIPNKNDATFDFGKNMRNIDCGLSLGFNYQMKGRFSLYGDLTYGLLPVFPSKFKGIDMKMRNIYFALGVGYRL